MLCYHMMWPLVYTSMQAGPPKTSHIDNAYVEVLCTAAMLMLSVNTVLRLLTYVGMYTNAT